MTQFSCLVVYWYSCAFFLNSGNFKEYIGIHYLLMNNSWIKENDELFLV